MTDTELKYENVLKRMDQKINSLAEAKGMTYDEFYDWSDRETARQEITEYEGHLIMAYQLDEAIKNIRNHDKQHEIDKQYWWRKRFYDDFDKVGEAIKRLTEVCSYIKDRYGYDYGEEYLLTLDEAQYESLTENRARRSKSSLKYED